jgi:hypothetical protein
MECQDIGVCMSSSVVKKIKSVRLLQPFKGQIL